MTGMNQLKRADIRVGSPLPWSCYDRNGRLLLRKGVTIAFEHQIDRLIGGGLFIEARGGSTTPAKHGEPECVFERLVALAWGLRTLFNELLSKTPAPDTQERLRSRARKILDACAADPGAAIATIHLDFQNPYMLSHHVHAAVACALLGKRLELGDDDLVSVVCAALTFDIGLVEFAHLEKQSDPLDEGQTETVQQHTLRAAGILQRAGVDDPVWLETILQHHERWNGQGYPAGMACEKISVGARLLAVADSYTAMIRSRAFRPARIPLEAQGELFRHMGILYDERICVALVKEFGMYPPGSIVRLAKGEVAVVKEKIKQDGTLAVMSVFDAKGMPYMSPQRRDTADEGYAVVRPLHQSECRSATVIIRRLWN